MNYEDRIRNWPRWAIDEFIERSAIMENDAGVDRETANLNAYHEILRRHPELFGD